MSSVSSTTAPTPTPVAPQGGILEGVNPDVFNPSNPIVFFIIQAGIIIIFCRLLHYPLSKIRQPRVIAEVLGGIILGPSVMMRIPGFQAAIFPPTATTNAPLNMAANLGLILFLFLVGLEVDLRMFMANWRVALSVGLAGMILPFGLGCALAWGLYNQFRSDPGTVHISFGVYMLFIGTAISITAFPVLCRILTELKILSTTVGVTVLAAGVGNDVTGWILLALCVALVNNGTGLAALYVLLAAIGWVLFLVLAVKPVFFRLLRRSGSLQNGPTQGMVSLTILLVLISAWFTAIIGIHPIFGAFLVGIICPHDGGFAIKLAEKIEDLVSVLLLPLYFALSGLSTNLGLLNDGITWAYVVGIIVVAFAGKIIGGLFAARACGLVWRESLTIGVLMSCKGLVELIVLNIGLQANILSKRTFTMFVVMALVTTVTTTPVVSFLYPPSYQRKLEAWKRGEIDWEGNRLSPENNSENEVQKLQNSQMRKLLVYLRLDSLPSLFAFITLLGGDTSTAIKVHPLNSNPNPSFDESRSSGLSNNLSQNSVELHGVRMLELTERVSSVMKVSEVDEYAYRDPVVNAFRTFAQLNNVQVSGGLSIVPESSYAETLTGKASDMISDLVLIPWSESGALSESDSSMPSTHFSEDRYSNNQYNTFVQHALDEAICNTAVFVNRGFGGSTVQETPARHELFRSSSGISQRSQRPIVVNTVTDRSHHIFFPFFGGADDRVALRFVLQLAQNSNVTATIVHVTSESKVAEQPGRESKTTVTGILKRVSFLPGSNSSSKQEKAAGTEATATEPPSPEAEAHVLAQIRDTDFINSIRNSLSSVLSTRVIFMDFPTNTPLSSVLDRAKQEVGQSPHNAGDLIVVGRHRSTGSVPTATILENEEATARSPDANGVEISKTLGRVVEGLIGAKIKASVLVVQAAGRGLEG